jgi:hypothetical protein
MPHPNQSDNYLDAHRQNGLLPLSQEGHRAQVIQAKVGRINGLSNGWQAKLFEEIWRLTLRWRPRLARLCPNCAHRDLNWRSGDCLRRAGFSGLPTAALDVIDGAGSNAFSFLAAPTRSHSLTML